MKAGLAWPADGRSDCMEANLSGRLEQLVLLPSAATALAALDEPIRHWFVHAFGDPTPAQRLAWPTLAAGRNLFLCAPTGSGKTLAAFLPIVGQVLTDQPAGV